MNIQAENRYCRFLVPAANDTGNTYGHDNDYKYTYIKPDSNLQGFDEHKNGVRILTPDKGVIFAKTEADAIIICERLNSLLKLIYSINRIQK